MSAANVINIMQTGCSLEDSPTHTCMLAYANMPLSLFSMCCPKQCINNVCQWLGLTKHKLLVTVQQQKSKQARSAQNVHYSSKQDRSQALTHVLIRLQRH